MAELRKVPREINRGLDKFDDHTTARYGLSPSRIYFRLFVDPRVKMRRGALALGPKAAIYLMFPSRGVLASHHIALRHILRCGYVPIVVSNQPLSQRDIEKIRPNVARIIVRPNIGYDFAGYRDAIRLLGDGLADLKYLAILNDSCWFPTDPSRNWFAEAEALSVDFAGSSSHRGIRYEAPEDGGELVWQYDPSDPEFHYGSYSLLIGRRPLHDPGFKAFWTDYRPARLKSRTVQRGETGLTRWIKTSGFAHAATLDTRKLPMLLDGVTDKRLQEIARNAITFRRGRVNESRDGEIYVGPVDRDALLRIVLREVAETGPGYALQDFDIAERHGSFVKKSPVATSRIAAEQTMRILDSISDPVGETFRAEARDMFLRKFGEPL